MPLTVSSITPFPNKPIQFGQNTENPPEAPKWNSFEEFAAANPNSSCVTGQHPVASCSTHAGHQAGGEKFLGVLDPCCKVPVIGTGIGLGVLGAATLLVVVLKKAAPYIKLLLNKPN